MVTVGREPLIMRHNAEKLFESVAICKSNTPELIKNATNQADILLSKGSISYNMHKNYLHKLDFLTTEFKKFCNCTRKK